MVSIPNPQRMGDMPSSEPVPESAYHLRIEKSEYKESSKGNPMCSVQLVIFGPEEAEEHHGRKVFDNLMLSGEGRFHTRQLLEALGYEEDFVFEDTDVIIGGEVLGFVSVEPERRNPDTGETYQARNAVKRYAPLTA